MNREAMLAAFDQKELRTFEGRGGKVMTYIEDETVMDRLDLGYGPGNWSVANEPISLADGVVKVRLGVKGDDGEWTFYEDFGYANGTNGELLKEAVSDGIRRCGRMVGIGRDLYRKSTYEGAQRSVARPAAAAPARPHLVDTDVPEVDEPEWLQPTNDNRDDVTTCPIHGDKWIGKPGDLWHKDPDGRYCRHPKNVKQARAR